VVGIWVDDSMITPLPAQPQPHWGPALWAELHCRPLYLTEIDAPAELARLARFTKRIPGCSGCRASFEEIQLLVPADLSSPRAYFAATVAWHNDVNYKLGQPIWTVRRALCYWWARLPPVLSPLLAA
jgi:hypothetical protein